MQKLSAQFFLTFFILIYSLINTLNDTINSNKTPPKNGKNLHKKTILVHFLTFSCKKPPKSKNAKIILINNFNCDTILTFLCYNKIMRFNNV